MMVLGLLLTFAPQEVLERMGSPSSSMVILLVQAAGALYFGFAMLNWMARLSLIGGIYGRPIAMGNFLHFGILASALGKAVFAVGAPRSTLIVSTLYLVFAVWFGWVLFGDPLARKAAQAS